MKKSEEDQTAENNVVARQNNIPPKPASTAVVKKTTVFPEEFEEDRSMNIRMKPQPFNGSVKKSTVKKID
ncbi:MAG: hypothetical protein H7258_14225 [Ferruginibacter sp.]|nr:hypothetical protein [Ferruginibacter sp.]